MQRRLTGRRKGEGRFHTTLFLLLYLFIDRIEAFSHCKFNMPVQEIEELHFLNGRRAIDQSSLGLRRWRWWILVGVNIFVLIVGQTTGVLLGRFYYDQGGNSQWMGTLVQTAAFPILFIPLFILSSQESSIIPNTTIPTDSTRPSVVTLTLICVPLGILIAGDNRMYSIGLSYLSASTYSLICATQLAFNAVSAFFINSQKFTALVLNSVVILTLSSALIGVDSDSTEPAGGKYILGFLCTLGASAVHSLLLSLIQLSFQKVLKSETFYVVSEMQIYTSLVATCCCIVGLFASGEGRNLKVEMDGFGKGRVSYVMTLVCTAVAWQVASLGIVGLIFMVSSLFSNVISTLALALCPIAAVIFFHDKMDGVKLVAMLMAFWGFASYLYQQYLDDCKSKAAINNVDKVPNESTSETDPLILA